ncbi:hypothetical protein [uncultured Methanobrevibacter sp.]|uniref:hypothetical protein n=1 Tax=uncultured Methanobrevibacter sp. TaxID=253161 RepID=UPI0025F274AF|nr:hypothetical protein [uncultured Methanobrevibacter sp.]
MELEPIKLVTLEDYDREITKMENLLTKMEAYIKEHPERLGYAGNYKTLKIVYDIIFQEREEYVHELTDIYLHLNGKSLENGATIHNLYKLSYKFNETGHLLARDFDELKVKSISEGSYKIQFGFKNPTDDDVKRLSPRKKGLLKLFKFIECGDDVEKLKKEAGSEDIEGLRKYKEFIGEIVKNEVDFTLDTEKGTLKAGLTLEQCRNICQNLNI